MDPSKQTSEQNISDSDIEVISDSSSESDSSNNPPQLKNANDLSFVTPTDSFALSSDACTSCEQESIQNNSKSFTQKLQPEAVKSDIVKHNEHRNLSHVDYQLEEDVQPLAEPSFELPNESFEGLQTSMSRGDAKPKASECCPSETQTIGAQRPETLLLSHKTQLEDIHDSKTPASELTDSITSQCSSSGMLRFYRIDIIY